MFLEVLRGVFSMANTFIALFIVIYAFLFLKKTRSHRERRPWDYLVIASIIYLAYTMLSMLFTIYNVTKIFNLSVGELSMFFQFIYTGLILLSFISQTDLIFKNEIIIITRRMSPEEKKRIGIKIFQKKKTEKVEEKSQDSEKPKTSSQTRTETSSKAAVPEIQKSAKLDFAGSTNQDLLKSKISESKTKSFGKRSFSEKKKVYIS